MFDPYKKDTPGMSDPAKNVVLLTPDDDNDIIVGVKALRIFNSNATTATIAVITVTGDPASLNIPALTLWTEPLRIMRLLDTGTSNGVIVHGYTDVETPV